VNKVNNVVKTNNYTNKVTESIDEKPIRSMKQEDYQEYYKEIPVKSNPNGPQGKKNNMNTQVL